MPDGEDLILRWELGQSDANDELALATLLRDPTARRAFLRNARIAAALGLSAPKAVAQAPEVAAPIRPKALRIRRRPPSPAPRWAIAAGLALTIALAGLVLTTMPRHDTTAANQHRVEQTPVPAPTPFAHLETAGVATITAIGGRQRTGRNGEGLMPGEQVASGTGTAVIVLGAVTSTAVARLELTADSEVTLPAGTADPATATVRLDLGRGRVHAEVAPRPAGAPFIITSPLANAEVVGTRFSFGVDRDHARLAVEHGAVRLSTPKEPGVLIDAGRSGLVAEGLASLTPTTADADQPLPAGSRVLWRSAPGQERGWRGVVEDAAHGGPAWRSVAPRPGDPWCRAELRSPVVDKGWVVETGTWLRFRYHVEHFTPGLTLVVHLKPADETNYEQRLVADRSDGWHQALMRVDNSFRHVERGQQPLVVGEHIHGAVWCVLRDTGDDRSAVRFWIRDAVVFSAP